MFQLTLSGKSDAKGKHSYYKIGSVQLWHSEDEIFIDMSKNSASS
jgi:hypothetical protein